MVRLPADMLHVGSAIVTTCPKEPKRLRSAVLQLSPSWLLLGDGLEDDKLASLVNIVQLVMPMVRLAVLGSTNDLDRCDRWIARGAKAYLRSTIQPTQVLQVLLLADEVGVAVIDESFFRLRSARQAQLRLTLMLAPHALTKRERAVLKLMRHGLRNSEIGTGLNIAESTIEFHVSNILSKLNATSRTEAVEKANALGF